MPTDETNQLIEQLSAALNEAGLAWILREVSAAVQEGRALSRVKVRSRRAATLLPVAPEENEPRRHNEHTRSDPYSREEQLQLLLAAIQGLFADSASLNRELVSEFGEIDFRSEDRLGEEPSFRIDQESVRFHAASADRVSAVLKQISEKAGL